MDKLKIYLSGRMSGLSFEEYTGWRKQVISYFNNIDFSDIKIFDPTTYYNYKNKEHKTEKEIMLFEMRKVRESDVLLVNLNGINKSVGTIFEVMEGSYNNKTIIAFGDASKVHPWLLEKIDRVEDNFSDACDYIARFLLSTFK